LSTPHLFSLCKKGVFCGGLPTVASFAAALTYGHCQGVGGVIHPGSAQLKELLQQIVAETSGESAKNGPEINSGQIVADVQNVKKNAEDGERSVVNVRY
jgi:hypothetical protein